MVCDGPSVFQGLYTITGHHEEEKFTPNYLPHLWLNRMYLYDLRGQTTETS